MPRTTVTIDAPALKELKLQQPEQSNRAWHVCPGDLRVDLLDKDEIYGLLDAEKVS